MCSFGLPASTGLLTGSVLGNLVDGDRPGIQTKMSQSESICHFRGILAFLFVISIFEF